MRLSRLQQLLLVLMVVGLWGGAGTAQQSAPTTTKTLTSTTCPGTGCLVVGVTGYGGIGVQLAGTFVGTAAFEGVVTSDTSGTYTTVTCTPWNSTTGVTSATTTGSWSCPVGGLSYFRIRMSAYTSGSIVVTTRTAATLARATGSGGGGGSPGRLTTAAPPPPISATAPSLDGSGAGNVSNGDHTYVFTLGNNDGALQTTPSVATAAVTVADNSVDGKIRVPVPIVGCDMAFPYLSIYRDHDSDGVYLLVERLAYQCFDFYVDGVADGSLGGAPPTTNTAIASTTWNGDQLFPPSTTDSAAVHWTWTPPLPNYDIYVNPPATDLGGHATSITFAAGNGIGVQGGDMVIGSGSGIVSQDVSPVGARGGDLQIFAGSGTLTRGGNLALGSGLGVGGGVVDGTIDFSIGADYVGGFANTQVFILARTFTVGTLPTCGAGELGSRTQVNDALAPVALSAVVGGGAVVVPVFCDGASWIVN